MVRLEPDQSCFSGLSWRLTSTTRSDAAIITQAATEAGWIDRSRSDLLREIHHPEGHVLVVGVATGRMQLRLSYLVPTRERPAVAHHLGEALGAAPPAALAK